MRNTTIAVAFTLLLAAAGSSHAQSARYCTNNMVVNSFYSNVLSNGKTAEVEYHGQFQNQDPKRQILTATLLPLAKIGNFAVTRPASRFDLKSYEQKDIVLLRLTVNNHGGTGAPTPAMVGSQIRFTCTYKPS